MSLPAILTGLCRLNSLLAPCRPHRVAHHHHNTAFKSSSLLQHPLLQFNPWLKSCLFTNCCCCAEKTDKFSPVHEHSALITSPILCHWFPKVMPVLLQPWLGTTTWLERCVQAAIFFACRFHSSVPVKTVPVISTFTSLFLKGLSILGVLTPQAGIFIMFASTCDFSGMTSPCYVN